MGSLRSTTALLNSVAGAGVQELQGGNFLLLLTASAPVQVRIERGNGGHAEVFDNISGGLLIRRVQPWANLRLLGTPGASVVFMYGTAETDKDETDIRLQIATIAGVASVAMSPANSVADTAPVVLATATAAALFPANALRRRVRVFVDEDNADTCYARTGAATNNIANLQPGSVYTFEGTYGLFVRNDTGANATFYIFEES